KAGDHVATYDEGRLGVSVVRNHKRNRPDFIYKIRTISGKIVRANERHPFLIKEHGQLRWVRLKNLTTAHRIVTLKDKKVSGKEKLVSLKAAESPLVAGDIVHPTITRSSGQMDIALHHVTQNRVEASSLNIATESPLRSTMQCSLRRME